VAALVSAAGEREGVSSKESDAHLLFALMQVCCASHPVVFRTMQRLVCCGEARAAARQHTLWHCAQVQEHVMNADRVRPLHVVSTVRHPETLVVADHIVR
jgi:hypothetical protein